MEGKRDMLNRAVEKGQSKREMTIFRKREYEMLRGN